jgi:carboxymethylenebutenolidase
MSAIKEPVAITTSHGLMGGALFRPDDDATHSPAIMIHGAPGLDAGTLQMADDLANDGFVVLAPDMFYRNGAMQLMQPGWSAEQRNGLQEGMTNSGDIVDVDHMVRYLHAQPYVDAGGVGITGFCMGGRIAYLAAARAKGIGAAVMYYPTGLVYPDPREPGSETPLDFVGQIDCPIIGFFPTLDTKHCSPEIRAQVSSAFETISAPTAVIPVEGADHGFIDPASQAYDAVEGPKAWSHMVSFFREHLG